MLAIKNLGIRFMNIKSTKKAIALAVTLSIASATAFANKATDKLDIYVEHLKMAAIAGDMPNIQHYSEAVHEFITTGGISKKVEPVVKSVRAELGIGEPQQRLAVIEPRTAKFRKTAANRVESRSIYDAINVLAVVVDVYS